MKTISIYPNSDFQPLSPYSQKPLPHEKIIFQGIHICNQSLCSLSHSTIISDYPIGHAIHTPYQYDITRDRLFGTQKAESWFGRPLALSLKNPNSEIIDFKVEALIANPNALILNCIDFIYGHSLLKLLNASKHLQYLPQHTGLIVIIQPCLRWLIPKGISEIWTANIPFSKAQNYYSDLDQKIHQEIKRFKTISLSTAYGLPTEFNISDYTQVPIHDFKTNSYRISYIWREHRAFTKKTFRKSQSQSKPVIELFSKIKKSLPEAKFSVIGLGKKSGTFPKWIQDERVESYTSQTEQAHCQLYSESRLVIGPQGSNLLLPSAHAGMTLHLMPDECWNNFAQDNLYQPFSPEDKRITNYRYRFVPIDTNINTLAIIAISMLKDYAWNQNQFLYQ